MLSNFMKADIPLMNLGRLPLHALFTQDVFKRSCDWNLSTSSLAAPVSPLGITFPPVAVRSTHNRLHITSLPLFSLPSHSRQTHPPPFFFLSSFLSFECSTFSPKHAHTHAIWPICTPDTTTHIRLSNSLLTTYCLQL